MRSLCCKKENSVFMIQLLLKNNIPINPEYFTLKEVSTTSRLAKGGTSRNEDVFVGGRLLDYILSIILITSVFNFFDKMFENKMMERQKVIPIYLAYKRLSIIVGGY